MKINLFRKIDFWVGIPVCFTLSFLSKIKSFFSQKKHQPELIKKIAFIQISEMGSAVSAFPSINYTKKKFPDSQIYYVIFNSFRGIIDILGNIEKKNILTIREDNFLFFITDTIKTIYTLRRLSISATIDLELFSRFSSILSFLSAAPLRVGFNKFKMEGLYRGNLQTHKVVYNCYQHIGYNFLTLAKSLESKNEHDIPLLKEIINNYDLSLPTVKSTSNEIEKIFNKLQKLNPKFDKKKKIIIVNPNASQLLPLRRWPLDYYINLVKMILDNLNVIVIIIGLRSEKIDSEKICQSVNNPNCLDFAGKTNLKELITLFNMSEIIISNDSGPPNFASLTNIKTFVLFGPETPILYRPLGKNVKVFYKNLACSPCVSAYNHRQSPCTDNKCLKKITIDEVYNVLYETIKDGTI